MNQLKFQDSSAIKSWRSAISGIWNKFWVTSFAPLSTNISVKHPQITFFDRNTVFYFIPYFTQKSVLTNISFNLYFTIHALLYSVILLLFTIQYKLNYHSLSSYVKNVNPFQYHDHSDIIFYAQFPWPQTLFSIMSSAGNIWEYFLYPTLTEAIGKLYLYSGNQSALRTTTLTNQ